MASFFSQLNADIAAIRQDLLTRKHDRRNWMERLMAEGQDSDDQDDVEGGVGESAEPANDDQSKSH